MKKYLGLLPKFENKKEFILRDYLALERTKLANERTLLTYIRSALYLLIGGITIMQLPHFTTIYWVAYFAFGSSTLFIIIGVIRFSHLRRRLRKFYNHDAMRQLDTDNKKAIASPKK